MHSIIQSKQRADRSYDSWRMQTEAINEDGTINQDFL